MPQPIVVGYDGSEHGRDALALGRALGEALSAPLVVVIAYTPDEWLWAPGTAAPMNEAEREAVVQEARAAFSEEDLVEIRVVASPSAAGALHAEAERVEASIVVVGSTHHGAMRRVLLGTVTQEVLDAAPCAVAVAQPGLAGGTPIAIARIGVCFDDSSTAHDALAVAHELALHTGAEARLLWAAHLTARALPMAAGSYIKPDYFEELRTGVQERLERAAAPLRGDVSVRTEILRGQTTDALSKESGRLDLLVLGSRGYGPLRRVLLGSVSRGVIGDAGCPVLVVPRGVETLRLSPKSDAAASGQDVDPRPLQSPRAG